MSAFQEFADALDETNSAELMAAETQLWAALKTLGVTDDRLTLMHTAYHTHEDAKIQAGIEAMMGAGQHHDYLLSRANRDND